MPSLLAGSIGPQGLRGEVGLPGVKGNLGGGSHHPGFKKEDWEDWGWEVRVGSDGWVTPHSQCSRHMEERGDEVSMQEKLSSEIDSDPSWLSL